MPNSATLQPAATRLTDLRGSTLPRIFTPPLVIGRPGPCGCGCALTAATSLGFSAIQFAEDVLAVELMPWQRWLLIHALEVLADGRFRFRTVLVLAARQNGKTLCVEVKNLWKLFVLKVPLVIGTAQILDYAEESWDKAVEMIEGVPELAAELVHVDRTNGKKAFKLVGGMRWKIAAASRKGGRSLSGDDVNLDELREHHTWESWGAVTKTTLARRKAQVWAFSNAGDDRSVVLNDLRDKGLAAAERLIEFLAQMVVAEAESIAHLAAEQGIDTSLGLFEWSAPDDCPIDDLAGLAQANPSLGYPQGIGIEALRAAMGTDPEPIFRTECLCQRVPDLVPSKIPLTAWVKCADPKSTMVGGLVLSWEVSWRRDYGTIAVAGYRADGLPHVEIVEYRQGTDWLPGRLAEVAKKHLIAAVVFNPSGPGASLLTDVTDRLPIKLEPKPMTARDQANACGRLYDAATWVDPEPEPAKRKAPGLFRHLGDDRLLEALRKSATRPLVDAWAWDMRTSVGEISSLAGITNALHGLYVHGKLPQPAPAPLVTVVSNGNTERGNSYLDMGF